MLGTMFETLVMAIIYLGVTSFRKHLYPGPGVTSFRKRTRVDNGGRQGGHKDLISELPDDILISIIARTPTKTAVRSSVLSKRWMNLYKSVSRIELCCVDLLSRSTYTPSPHALGSGSVIYRLERFLRLCSGSKILSFKLGCCLTESDKNRFEQCCSYLGKSGVEKLSLDLSCRGTRCDVSFPCHLLSEIPSLKQLALFNCSLQSSVKSKCYSLSLQTLYLSNVMLLPASLECILSNCLSLHSLTMLHCKCPPKLSVHGPSLQLKTLNVECCLGVEEIELCATNLTTFECSNFWMLNFIFDYVPQLETIYICIYGYGENATPNLNIMAYVFGELPKGVPHIKSLNFNIIEGGFGQGSALMGMETFGNLRRLEICASYMPRVDLMALTPYLESCPLLEELILNLGCMDYNVDVERKPVVVFHTKLKKVELSGFNGADNEIEFALYILKTALALDQMFIISCRRVYDEGDGSGTPTRNHGVKRLVKILSKVCNTKLSPTLQNSLFAINLNLLSFANYLCFL